MEFTSPGTGGVTQAAVLSRDKDGNYWLVGLLPRLNSWRGKAYLGSTGDWDLILGEIDFERFKQVASDMGVDPKNSESVLACSFPPDRVDWLCRQIHQISVVRTD